MLDQFFRESGTGSGETGWKFISLMEARVHCICNRRATKQLSTHPLSSPSFLPLFSYLRYDVRVQHEDGPASVSGNYASMSFRRFRDGSFKPSFYLSIKQTVIRDFIIFSSLRENVRKFVQQAIANMTTRLARVGAAWNRNPDL